MPREIHLKDEGEASRGSNGSRGRPREHWKKIKEEHSWDWRKAKRKRD